MNNYSLTELSPSCNIFESLSSLKTVLDPFIKESISSGSSFFRMIFFPSDSKIGRRYYFTTYAAISGVIDSFVRILGVGVTGAKTGFSFLTSAGF